MLRLAPRADRGSASGAPSGSDSDSESKPEARNSSTVSSARRLRVTPCESRLPPARWAPAPLPREHGEEEPDLHPGTHSPLAAPRRRHACRAAACAPLPVPACLAPGALPPGRPRPAAPAGWLYGSPAEAPAACGREGAFTASRPGTRDAGSWRRPGSVAAPARTRCVPAYRAAALAGTCCS